LSASEGLFGGQAGDYRTFRPAWPEEVFTRILERTPRPRARALDLGAGTGHVSARLVEHFEEVTALEPDARMLGELEPRPGLATLHARAEEARFEPGSFQLVTAGNAFHWMDGPAVLARAREWLAPGGLVALFHYNPPHTAEGALEELLDREYAVVWRAHVHPRLHDLGYTRRTLAASSFGARLEARRIPNDLSLTLAELMGFLRSTSYGGGYARSLPDPDAYWRELEARIAATSGSGPFVLDFHVELSLATKA
jgi:SAM-dependent methyltransferase